MLLKLKTYLFLMLVLCFFFCGQNQEIEETSPIVTAVFPTSDSLPENLLRMYIQFSKAMKTVGNLEKIKLLDEKGQEMVGAIFNNVYELWDKDQKQLTLIFDPARVKSGLKVHEQLGRALKPGKSYQLLIEGLEDVDHVPLGRPFIKRFFVTSADTVPPAIQNWEIESPPPSSRKALQVHFPDVLDQQSLRTRLVVTHSNDEALPGQVSISNHERTWQFTPMKSWKTGFYHLYVNTRLEDPAGNNLNGLFDHHKDSLTYIKEGQTIQLSFKIP